MNPLVVEAVARETEVKPKPATIRQVSFPKIEEIDEPLKGEIPLDVTDGIVVEAVGVADKKVDLAKPTVSQIKELSPVSTASDLVVKEATEEADFVPAEVEIRTEVEIPAAPLLGSMESLQNEFIPAGFVPEVPKANLSLVENKPSEVPEIKLPLPSNEFAAPERRDSEIVETELPVPSRAENKPVKVRQQVSVQPRPEIQIVEKIVDMTVPWDVQLDQVISRVEGQIQSESDTNNRNGLEVHLRLLQVLKRQLESVEVRQASMSATEKAYWQHQLDAINVMLETDSKHSTHQAKNQATLDTLDHLRKAIHRLEAIAGLQAANPAFCSRITGFGQFQPMPSNNFSPLQRLLVYCEVENYRSEQKSLNQGLRFHTQLQGSYAIYDSQGRVVQQAEFPAVEDVARQKRRDFYMYFPVQLNDLASGEYRMELLIEDHYANKTAAVPSMRFQVR